MYYILSYNQVLSHDDILETVMPENLLKMTTLIKFFEKILCFYQKMEYAIQFLTF